MQSASPLAGLTAQVRKGSSVQSVQYSPAAWEVQWWLRVPTPLRIVILILDFQAVSFPLLKCLDYGT